jgi:ATP adenylyltransferase
MDRIWSPWRRAYVTATTREPGCVLCRSLERAAEADSLVVHVAADCFVVMNLYPYSAGHVMIVPRRHVGSLAETTAAELAEMMGLARRMEAVLAEAYTPDGINVGMNLGKAAGAGVADHIHLHVVPRWAGDTNFMTTIADTRVIPEDPVEACARLRERLRHPPRGWPQGAK